MVREKKKKEIIEQNMIGYDNLYLSDISRSDYDSIMSYGLCVKSCPSATQAADPKWWNSNCKSNSVTKCD